jgi:diguanylate cyclase (GGDEF)-like protein/PAS domain S-box-containing protein
VVEIRAQEQAVAEIGDELLSLFESAPDLIFTQDLRCRFQRVNSAFERITGYTRSEALNKTFFDFVAPDQRTRVRETLNNVLGGGTSLPEEVALVTASGALARVEVCWRVAFSNGVPAGWVGFARDLSGREREFRARADAETRLLEKTNELARFSRHLQLLHHLSNKSYENFDDLANSYLAGGCEIFDTEFGVLTAADGALFTVRSARAQGMDLEVSQRIALQQPMVQRILSHRETETVLEKEGLSFCVGTPIVMEEKVYGTIAFFSASETNAATPHPQGREIIELMAKRIAIWMDQRQLTDQLAYQAHHDALTGLPNRLYLRDRLDEALDEARESGAKLAVMFIDLDRFKQINDTLGHTIGDGLLQQVAARLKNCMKEQDVLARMGGDEFTAILTDIQDTEEAVQMARRLLSAVRKSTTVESFELFIAASIGLAFYPRDGRDAATLLRNADSAMYAAKSRGKNGVHCFNGDAADSAFERLELENSLRRALDNNELRIYYQPQVNVAQAEDENSLAGLEVLLMWEHPRLGRISPSQFIPIAEESGMILQIGSWVLRQACLQTVAWREAGYAPVRFSVNVSALQFAQDNFVTMVAGTVAETGVDPNLLELELTESLVMQDVEESVNRMTQLRRLGVRIAIDDFGTGYSSLSYLRKLPADTLKIDRSFLQDSEFGPGALPLIQTITILAHNMGLSVTAEGVETQVQLELVRKAGCDEAQGHLFGAPLDFRTVEGRLQRPGAAQAIQNTGATAKVTL